MENKHQDKEIEPSVELGPSLEETLKSSGAIEIGAASADLIIGGLPVFTALARLPNAWRSVSDYYLAKKLASFLSEIAEVPLSDRAKMVEKLEREPEYAERVGDQIILLLDRLDDLQKPGLMGRAFRAYCDGHIDGAMLTRINRVISSISLRDLIKLKDIYLSDARRLPTGDFVGGIFKPYERDPRELMQTYIIVGLARLTPPTPGSSPYPFDDLCIAIIKHILEAPVRVFKWE